MYNTIEVSQKLYVTTKAIIVTKKKIKKSNITRLNTWEK